MTKEKQIEEMAFDLCRIDLCKHLEQEECDATTCVHCTAEALYTAGYRKASEIFEEIIEALTEERIEENRKADSALEAQDTASYEVYSYAEDKLATLVTALSLYKKKYTEEGK